MGMVKQDDGWRLPDKLWAQMEPLLPLRKPKNYLAFLHLACGGITWRTIGLLG